MAAAAQVVEGLGADIVDVNMGCPVPKIAKHNAGCSLMREPAHAATVIGAMAKAVKIPVTVKMRAGWNDRLRNAPDLARRVQDAGAAAVTIHGRTAEQSYSGSADWNLVSEVAHDLSIPVLGSGDCIEPSHVVERLGCGVSGVLVGRGVLRNPWILAQAAALSAGRTPRDVTLRDRGQFLLDYIDLLISEGMNESEGFRHVAEIRPREARGRERWVINKLRALCAWYSKGIDCGSHLRVRINATTSVQDLRDNVVTYFCERAEEAPSSNSLPAAVS
jgi:tRNA-dihydrouridine synthase B